MKQKMMDRALLREIYGRGQYWAAGVLEGLAFTLAPPTKNGGSSRRYYALGDVIARLRLKSKNNQDEKIRQLIEGSVEI